MPRIAKPLTNIEIEKAKPKDKDYTLSDGKGLYLLVKTNKSKLWRFDYTNPITKKRGLMGFGSYPEVSLAQAREMRETARSQIAQGINPQEHRKQAQEKQAFIVANTFKAIAVQWYEYRKTKANFSDSHAYQTWQRVERHLLPHFGDLPISQITAPQAIAILHPLQIEKKLTELKRVVQILNEIFTYALHREIVSFNPCQKISKEFDSPQTKHYRTIRPEQLADFLSRLRDSRVSVQLKQAVLWQLLTMARPTDAISAKWEDIDFNECIWTIYVQKGIKTEEKGRVHKVTLQTQAIKLLEEIKAYNNSPFVFPSFRKPNSHLGSNTVNNTIKKIGYGKEIVAHGLRAIASTYLNEQGYDTELVEIALSHIDKDRIRKAYNRGEYLERRTELLQIWGDFIERSYNV
ncbi:TPA: tyrosine-type recombinase/integrase [Mannheimia haemolytica]